MLTVGVPREIKPSEKRVGLTPEGVRVLTRQGILVLVEKDAGALSGFTNQTYEEAGAAVLLDAKSVYRKADLIQKVKEPLSSEWPLLRKSQIVFSFFHLASPDHCELVRKLRETGVTAVAYETLEVNGKVPLLAPMSEMAGALASAYAGLLMKLKIVQAGRIIYPENFKAMLENAAESYPQPPKDLPLGHVIIFGGGAAGEKAAALALEMNGQVVLVECDSQKRESLAGLWPEARHRLSVISPEALSDEHLRNADVLIGCVHRPGYRAFKVFDAATLQSMSENKKKILMDVAIDQGGNFPEAHATTYDDPLYLDSCGNLRFAVANMPSFCGKKASEAITQATLPYTAAMAEDFEAAMKFYPELLGAINIKDGVVIHPAVKAAHQK